MLQPASSTSTPAGTETPSMEGMTTKVFKGGAWTFVGQLLPLSVSLFTTPFVIRLLGSEAYGVFVLVLLIPSYFNFADLGMSLASTKYGSEAYAQGLRVKEGEVVRTAALISFTTSLPIGLILFLFSSPIIKWLNTPENLQAEASLALKFAAVAFVLNLLSTIFNTPQLSRLRMDLNAIITGGVRILGLIATPIVLYFGGGVALALLVLMVSSILALAGHIIVSGRLLNELYRLSINRDIIKPLLKFGGALFFSGIASILLVNLEKIVLASSTSVKALAYYSVAFTLANMVTMFSGAMIQSLIPAFSQLLGSEKKDRLNSLFSRSLRINIIALIPLFMFMFVIAKPFFTIWAGADFGRESTLPFYILLLGLMFNIVAFVPYSIIMSSGRTDIFAKLYWIELFPYIFIAAILTYKFKAVGAAIAWSLRVILDAAIIIWFSKRTGGVSFNIFELKSLIFLLIFSSIAILVVILSFITDNTALLLTLVVGSISLYFVVAWKKIFQEEERKLVVEKVYEFIKRQGANRSNSPN